jgi:hypothetical protein
MKMAIDLSLKCQVEGCDRVYYCKGYCRAHYERIRYHGNTDRLKAERGEGYKQRGYNVVMIDGVTKPKHVWIAEKALGKELPKGAVVHHMDKNRSNNDPSNLVVCPDGGYHSILHKRMRAYEACGNANYLKCYCCGKYDDPKNIATSGSHHECKKISNREYHSKKKSLRDGRTPTIRHILEANKE